MTLHDRRGWLQLAAASAATLWLPKSAWSQPKIGVNPFSLGVASGSPTHDSVVLWTRLHPPGEGIGKEPVTVRYELAHDEAFSRIAQRGQVQALPQLGHAVHAEVQGLEPDRWYFYRFMVGGVGNDWVSTTGRTRTFARPDAEAARLRLAYASCQRWEHGYFGAYRHMLQEDLDCVLFLGDYIYEYPNTPNPVRLPTGSWLHTLDDYRGRYALYKGEPELQAMHAACPWITTWDDHEVQNDYAGLVAGNAGPNVPDFAARRAAAYQAYYEHMPLRAGVLMQALEGLARGAEMRIYGSVAHGRLARLYVLDDRQYRDPQLCNTGGRLGSSVVNPETCPNWNDPKRTLLGAQQEQWLDNAFATQASGAAWNVVAQQSLYGRRDSQPGPGAMLWNDGWDGYSAARNRLTAGLQKHRVANPVFLGGDVHENWVGHVLADYEKADSAKVGVEFCGTSLTSRSGGHPRVPERLAENPHFIFGDAQRRGYGVAEFTPKRLNTTLRVVDDVTRRDPKIETLARFGVEAGRSVVERA